MSVDSRVKQYITTDIPEGRCSLSKSHQDLRALAEHCQKEITRHQEPALQTTQVYAAQSLASVAYQINTLAGQLVDLLKLQCDQWGEMEHQISDIDQQFSFYEEKRSRHLIGKFTSEKPVHLMRRVNPPAQKETPTKYERHPINFTVWDHIGHGSPTRDSVPAADSPAKRSQPRTTSYGQDRRSQLTTQASIIDSDIYGTSFDANRYLKKPVAHSIPIAHAIPRTDPSQDTERDFTATSELFTQGHTTDSLYDSLVHIPGDRRASETSEKQLLAPTLSDMYQDPELTMSTPSPLTEPPLSPLSDTPRQLSPPPEEPEPDFTLDDLDKDIYTPEDLSSLPIDFPPPSPPIEISMPPPPEPIETPMPPPPEPIETPMLPPPEPIETPKPPRPANPAPSRPAPLVSEAQKRPSRSAPGAPPAASVPAAPGPPISSPPPPPASSVPSRPAPPSGTVRPTRPAPPPGAALAKLSAPEAPPSPRPFVDDPNVPAPPPDLPGPFEADPRVPPPPPNIPKDGVTRAGKIGSVSDVPASPTKKVPPKPAPKGFDPSDIINMQKSLKKKAALRAGATIDIPTQSDSPPPASTPEQAVQSVPVNFPPPPAPAPVDSSASFPDPPADIPDGWNKKPVGSGETAAKKSAPPKAQPPKSPAFDPSQILQRKLRPSHGSGSSSPAEQTETDAAPPSYIAKVETIYPYKAQKEDELNFGKGKVIYVLKKNPDGWFEGYMEGVRGLFPENYSKPID